MYRYEFATEEVDVSVVTGSNGSVPMDALNGMSFFVCPDGLVRFIAFLPHGEWNIHTQVIVKGRAELSRAVASEVCSRVVSYKWATGKEFRLDDMIDEVLREIGEAEGIRE